MSAICGGSHRTSALSPHASRSGGTYDDRKQPGFSSHRPTPRAEIRAGAVLVRRFGRGRTGRPTPAHCGAGMGKLQGGHGIGHVPSGDFSLYDHVLDTACMLGAIPAGYGWLDGPVSLRQPISHWHAAHAAPRPNGRRHRTWPARARNDQVVRHQLPLPGAATDARPAFRADRQPAAGQFREATALPLRTRPVLLGPVSFLALRRPRMAPIRSTCCPGCCRFMRRCCAAWRKPMPPGSSRRGTGR